MKACNHCPVATFNSAASSTTEPGPGALPRVQEDEFLWKSSAHITSGSQNLRPWAISVATATAIQRVRAKFPMVLRRTSTEEEATKSHSFNTYGDAPLCARHRGHMPHRGLGTSANREDSHSSNSRKNRLEIPRVTSATEERSMALQRLVEKGYL